MIADDDLVKELDKIKEIIGIEKFDDTKILIDMDHIMPNNIALNTVVILIFNVLIKIVINFIHKQF